MACCFNPKNQVKSGNPFSSSADDMDKSYDSDRKSGENFSTLTLHHGQHVDAETRARAPPIYMTTSFCFKDSAHGAGLFELSQLGPIYTRIMNPTNHMLEYRIAKLEGSACNLDPGNGSNHQGMPSALAVASGQAAQLHALCTICEQGDWIISASELYGGTYAQFAHTLTRMGYKFKFINIMKLEELTAAFAEIGADKVKCVYCETISNPSYNIPDFDEISKICKANNTPLMVDNTFGMCGYVCRPIKFGADLLVESCTKWIGGHGTTIGGVIVDANSFDWSVKTGEGKSKFPSLAENCPAYHGMNFNGVFGPNGPFKSNMAFIFHARVCALRDLGGCQSPMGAFQLMQGLETLALRGKAHCDNANELAAWLAQHPKIEWVSHPSLPNHPSNERAKKYFRGNTYGSVLSFGVKGGFEAAKKFINSVKLASHLANVGDAKTLVIHPPSTTHQQLSDEEQSKAGVSKDMIRCSVGFEDIEDIKTDFEQALNA